MIRKEELIKDVAEGSCDIFYAGICIIFLEKPQSG